MSFSGLSIGENSSTYGLFAGYDNGNGNNWILGAEVNIDKLDYSSLPFQTELTTKRIKARLGYDMGDLMIFGNLGYAEVSDGAGEDVDGYTLGIGMDYRITDSIVVGAELLRDSYGYDDIDMDVTSLRLRIAYRF